MIAMFTFTGVHEIDTDQLVAEFGIPKGHFLRIHAITYTAGGQVELCTIEFDGEMAPPVSDTVPEGNINMIRIGIPDELGTIHIIFPIPIDVKNRIVVSVDVAWRVTFNYEYVEGELDWKKETAELLSDIKQVSARESRSAGQEFYQAGDFNQVGEPD